MAIQCILKIKFVKGGEAPGRKESLRQSYSVPGNRDLPRAAISIVSDGRAVENNKEKRLVPEQIKKNKKKGCQSLA